MTFFSSFLGGVLAPDTIQVDADDRSRLRAVQQLIRPEDIGHLITREAAPAVSGATFTDRVADWLASQIQAGHLVYRRDPLFRDVWQRPRFTLLQGGGDCEDLAFVVLSLLVHEGITAQLAIGQLITPSGAVGHAWVEGDDASGGFLIEATSGNLHRHQRPLPYHLTVLMGRNTCHRAEA